MGQPERCWQFWAEFADDRTLAAVRDGIPVETSLPKEFPPPEFRDNFISEVEEVEWTDEEIARLKEEGALELFQVGGPRPFALWVFPIHLVPKAGAKRFRLVVDMRRLNKYMPDLKCKMEGLGHIIRMAGRGWWAISFDMEAGYHHFKILPEHRRFLGIFWKGNWYHYNVLPFGMKSSPWWFTKIIRVVIKRWRRLGIFVVAYLDDFVVLARTKEDLIRIRDQIIAPDLVNFGLIRAPQKGQWEPTQQLKVLGLILDLENGLVIVPQEKIEACRRGLSYLVSGASITAKTLASVTGKIMSVVRAFAPAKLYTREFYRVIDAMNRRKWEWTHKVVMTPKAIQDAWWLLKNLEKFNGRPAWKPSRLLTIYTDASDSGWGFHVPALDLRGGSSWCPQKDALLIDQHIAFRETAAVFNSLVALKEMVRSRSIVVRADNRWTVAYLRDGGGRREDLTLWIEKIWTVCIELDLIIFEVEWIPGITNSVADHHSRWVDTGDWRIQRSIFLMLDRKWGPHSIDRMASDLNNVVPRFNSRRLCPGTEAVDCFTQAWGEENNFILPPFAMIERVLRHVLEEEAVATVIIPVWPAQHWWPLLLSMVTDWWHIPGDRNAFIPGPSGYVEPWKSKEWTFAAVQIRSSGRSERG